MCVVSNIGDYGRKDWTPYPNNPLPSPPWDRKPLPSPPWDRKPYQPQPQPMAPDIDKLMKDLQNNREPSDQQIEEWIKKNSAKWNLKKYNHFKKLLEEAKKMDELMGDPECEDPEKTRWIAELDLFAQYLKAKYMKKTVKKLKASKYLKPEVKAQIKRKKKK